MTCSASRAQSQRKNNQSGCVEGCGYPAQTGLCCNNLKGKNRRVQKRQVFRWIGHFRITFSLIFKMSPIAYPFIWHSNLTHFHTNGQASGLVFKTRVKVIGKFWIESGKGKVFIAEYFMYERLSRVRPSIASYSVWNKFVKFSALSSHMINCLITEFSLPERENVLTISHVVRPKYLSVRPDQTQ